MDSEAVKRWPTPTPVPAPLGREEAVRALAMLGHELRGSLAGVSGLLEALRRQPLDDEQQELARGLDASTGCALRLLDSVIDLARLGDGAQALREEPFELAPMLESASGMVHGLARAAQVGLQMHVEPRLPRRWIGDAARLQQIVVNLAGNAIKFSRALAHPGRVQMRVRLDAQGELELRVEDNGVGIAPEAQARLFQPFVQADAEVARRHGGSGLGLAICRMLVDAMGGRIELASQPGAGTAVRVVLPRVRPVDAEADAQADAQAVSPEHDLAGLRCLLRADDDPLWADIAADLRWAGALVDDAPQGAAAVAGRGELLIGAASRLVAAEIDAALAAGAAVLVADPQLPRLPARIRSGLVHLGTDLLRRRRLLLAVAQAAGRAAPELAAVRLPAAARRLRGRVLIVDDDPVVRLVLRGQLGVLGLACDEAGDGRQALARWRDGALRYGAVITDLAMPGDIDGVALTVALGAGMPGAPRVIVLSGSASLDDARRSEAAGASAFLLKPLALEQLRLALRPLLPGAAPTPAWPGRLVLLDGDATVLRRLTAAVAKLRGPKVERFASPEDVVARLAGPAGRGALVLAERSLASGRFDLLGQLAAAQFDGQVALMADVPAAPAPATALPLLAVLARPAPHHELALLLERWRCHETTMGSSAREGTT